jgi:hypothetical protein
MIAMDFLRAPMLLGAAMQRAVSEWPISAEHHLSDRDINHRAWLGWAAVSIVHGIPSHVTRAAWWQLSDTERADANDQADIVLRAYRARDAETLPF